MNLIIDIGNTQTKYALFRTDVMIEFCTSQAQDIALIEEWQNKYSKLSAAIVSSVQGKPDDFLKILGLKFPQLIFFDQNTLTPLENLYESKATLGYDRLAACVGANALQYLGGTISPGLSMRFKALNEFTKKLPLIDKSDSCQLIGNNTSQAIISGVQNGLLFEIDAYINQIKEKHADAKFFLTGGDADFLFGKLQNQIEMNNHLLLSLKNFLMILLLVFVP